MAELNWYLFSWDKVPGPENDRLKEHLLNQYSLPWIPRAQIRKSMDGNSLLLMEGSHLIYFRYDGEKRAMILHLENGEVHEYEPVVNQNIVSIYLKEVSHKLKALDRFDLAGLEMFAGTIRDQSQKEILDLVTLLHSDDLETSEKSSLVLYDMGYPALDPLLSKIDRNDPEEYAAQMKMVVDLFSSQRNAVIRELKEMLDDTAPVPPPDLGPNVEKGPIPRRVCDEAYLLFQPNVYPERSEEERFFHEMAFMNMSDDERDREIRKMRETTVWKHLFENT